MHLAAFQSLRARLLILAGLSAVVALAVAATAFVYNDVQMLNAAKRQQLHHFAGLISLNSQRSLADADYGEAERLLNAMRLDPTITAACLYDADGKVVASYLRDATGAGGFPAATEQSWSRAWGDDELAVYQNIHLDSQRVGALFLRAAKDDTRRQMASYAFVTAGAVTVSLIAACALAFRLQGALSRPIERLVHAANQITNVGDYSVRVDTTANGDLGELCVAFNGMLDRIEMSGAALQEAHDELNARVRERTRALQSEVHERRHAESVVKGQNRVLKQLAAGRPLPEVLGILITELESQLRNSHLAIAMVDERCATLVDPITNTLHRRVTTDQAGVALDPSGNAAARAGAVLSPQFDSELGRGAEPDANLVNAMWAFPVLANDSRPLAVLSVYHRHDREANDEELGLIEAAASLASVAIEQRHGEAALTRAMQKATAANRAKSEFLANMSHEIRTPLNAILGFADLMLGESESLTAEHRDHVATISTSGRHLLELINDILDLSKIEAGQVEVDRERVDPNALLVDVMSLLRVRAQEKGVALEYSWETGAPESVDTDPARFRQLLVNLIGNAIKFTEKGSVRVVAAVEDDEDGGRDATLRVDIIDTGIGIDSDKLKTIFDPFVQADSSVTRRFGGTGLGLAISRRIALALGGKLSVESTPGVGSRFTIRVSAGDLSQIPRIESPLCDGLRPGSRKEHKQASVDLTGLRILVVDDGETNRRLMSLVLRRAGVSIEMAENGREAVEAVAACPFDAILMDMQMPVMDGYSATRRLRDSGVTTPIMALTANAMKGDERKCLEAGCSAYLTKPIDPPRLLAELGRLCDRDSEPIAPENASPPTAVAAGPIYSTLPTDDEEFRDVVAQFLDKCREETAGMRRLANERSWPALRGRAHWLKGSGGTAGFPELSDLAERLEAALAGDPDPAEVDRRLAAIEELQERLAVGPTAIA